MINDKFYHIIENFLLLTGVSEDHILLGTDITVGMISLIVASLIFYIVLKPISRIARILAQKTRSDWDDRLVSTPVMSVVALAVALGFLMATIPLVFAHYPTMIPPVKKFFRAAMIVTIFLLVNNLVKVVYNGMREDKVDVAGLAVIRNIILTAVGSICGLMIISILIDKSPAYILSGLGAMAAVLSLVFKDSILGMTAGIRLVTNKMIKHDDWVIVPSYNANGRVEDVHLSAVKIRNWDNSISTVPPHALLNTGFKNMEQMLNEGTRQIVRTLHIDVHSVKRISDNEMSELKAKHLIDNEDTDAHNQINLALWRRYIYNYLSTHPMISLSPRCMVRELPATSEGIPIEIHCFINCIDWAEFEMHQADITDYIISTLPDFGLRPYQLHAFTRKKEASLSI